MRLNTTVASCVAGEVALSSGDTLEANTLVWTAGVQPNPALETTDLPRGPRGHVTTDTTLAVVNEDGSRIDGVWAIGDAAQIPDLTAVKQPSYHPPNAQNAMRQGPVAARNAMASLVGLATEQYRHVSLGTVASFGIATGAANIKGVRLRGLPAWLAHRGYHLLALPTFGKKARVLIGWLSEFLTGTESTPLRMLEDPHASFRAVFTPHHDDASADPGPR